MGSTQDATGQDIPPRHAAGAESISHEFLRGQMDGRMLTLHLVSAIKLSGPLCASTLLPDLSNRSDAYRSGLKAAIMEDTFPKIINAFYETPRSGRERLQFMDEVLRYLR